MCQRRFRPSGRMSAQPANPRPLRRRLPPASKRWIFSRRRSCARPSTGASAAAVSIACDRPTGGCSASITWCRRQSSGEIPTATWFPAVWTAMRRKAYAPRRVSPPALPRALLESPGPRRAAPRPGCPHLGQTPPAASRAFLRAVYGRAVERASGLRCSSWILKSTNLSVSAKGKRKDGLLRFQRVTSDRLASCTILPDSTALHSAGFGVTDSRGDL